MKKLILIRHSYAENGSFNSSDFDRELTDHGQQYATVQSSKLKELMPKIDLFISSNAKRAVQTSEILKQFAEYLPTIRYEHFLYEDYTTQDFINFVHSFKPEHQHAIIVGHNPTLANIAYRLCPEFNHSVSPGTIIVIDFEINDWTELEVNSGILKQVLN